MPTTTERLLAIFFGTAGAYCIEEGTPGVLMTAMGHTTEALPLENVAGKKQSVPLGHPWVDTTRQLGNSSRNERH